MFKWSNKRVRLVRSHNSYTNFGFYETSVVTLYKLCAFPVRHISIPGEESSTFSWGTFPFPVTHIPIHSEESSTFSVRPIPIPGEAHPHSWWGIINILSEVHPHSRWGTSPFLVRMFILLWFILTGNGFMSHQECTSSPEIGMCLTGNAHPHREWGCASPGMHILTRNGDVPHWEWTSSPGMGMCLNKNAHSHQQFKRNYKLLFIQWKCKK